MSETNDKKGVFVIKRISVLLLLTAVLLCGCSGGEATKDTATFDESKRFDPMEKLTAYQVTEAPTAAPTEPPTPYELAKAEYNSILDSSYSGYAELDVDEMKQYPELPSGCESVALTMALNYYGADLDKTDIADDFLEYGNNFATGFVGNPHTYGGAGVYPPGIVTTVENYTDETGEELFAFDTTGLSLEELYAFLDADTPVVVWTTVYLDTPYFESGTTYNDTYYPWYDLEHCVCLYGYDEEENKVMIADPQRGKISVSASRFEEIYDKIGRFSVVILDT